METVSLSSTQVLITAKSYPMSKERAIIGYDVVGGAEAKPKGFAILTPQISVCKSTASISVKNPGSYGVAGTVRLLDS